MTHVPLSRATVAVLAVLLLAGCGGNTVRVTGQLVKDGQPFTAMLEGPEPDTLAVDFFTTIEEQRYAFGADVMADGTFVVRGSGGRGIPRGQYRIAVLSSGFLGAGGDRFKGRYAEDKTPLTVDITEATSLIIDLGAGTVTK